MGASAPKFESLRDDR